MKTTIRHIITNAIKDIIRRHICGQTGIASLRMFLLTACLWFGTGMLPVQAKSTLSHGNLIYRDARGGAGLYAADILLLEEKLSSIPERCFDPVCYAHTHHWEYRSINERTHTRHCADCGDTNDLTDVHKAVRTERDTILHKGKSYPGKRFICACAYQWCMELTHTMIYEPIDAVSHRVSCELDGTTYCRGYEPSVEEHYAWYYEAGSDERHHIKICFDCGYQTEETCSFAESEGNENQRVCVCGRTAAPEEDDSPETGEPPEATETLEPPEPPKEGETPPEASETPETPEEESETPPEETEKPETPTEETEMPETPPEETEKPEAPTEEPEKPETPPEETEKPKTPPETPPEETEAFEIPPAASNRLKCRTTVRNAAAGEKSIARATADRNRSK